MQGSTVSGRDNCLPDYLSRYPRDQEDDPLFNTDYGLESKTASTELPPDNPTLSATIVLRPRKNKPQSIKDTATADTLADTSSDTTLNINNSLSKTSSTSTKFSTNYFDTTKIQQEQSRNPDVQHIIRQLQKTPNNLPFIFKDHRTKLITSSPYSPTRRDVIYLPASMIKPLLYACHNDPMTGGPFSVDRTYNKIKHLYWWPKMKLSIS